MSTEPSESILDAVGDAERLAAEVEAHLDEAPLPVDEEQVQRIAARLEARMQGPRAASTSNRPVWPVLLGVGLALAAATLVWTRVPVEAPPPQAPTLPTIELEATLAPLPHVEIPAPPELAPAFGVQVTPGSRVLTSPERRETVVVLVQEGSALLSGTEVTAGHFGIQTRTDEGTVVTWFRDGERPPEQLEKGVFAETAVNEQLEELRWRALPDATLSTLDALLEAE